LSWQPALAAYITFTITSNAVVVVAVAAAALVVAVDGQFSGFKLATSTGNQGKGFDLLKQCIPQLGSIGCTKYPLNESE
jgi:hypothetical protein